MKIVIISRQIYPALGPRSHRATELAKYFASQHHDVYIYGVLGNFNYTEFEKKTGVHVRNIGKMKFATLNSDNVSRYTIIDRIATKLFKRSLEYPDIELVWKTKKILTTLKDVDLLITIAFPYPIHWGTALAKKKMGKDFPKVWISDCGDPYMGNSIYSHPKYFHFIENFWGKETDYITIPIEEGRPAYSPNVQEKIRIIPQGFDFSSVKTDVYFKGNKVPRFSYTGQVYPGYRDPTRLLQYLSSLVDVPFEFVIYAPSFNFYEPFKSKLGDKLILKKYIPREQLIFELSQMDFLINLKNKSSVQAPSKLIDFYLTGRPIIDITTEFVEEENMESFLRGDYRGQHIKQDISKFDIRNVGNQFISLAR